MQDAGPGRDTQKILDMVEEATVVITAEMERELAALKKMLAEGESGNSELISKLEQSLGDLLAKAGTGAALAGSSSPKGGHERARRGSVQGEADAVEAVHEMRGR